MQGENRVAWREGMFLRPQHFQQQDRFVDALIRARTEALRPYPWGLTALKINASLASLGKFAIERCAGLFADGQPFSTPDDTPPPPPLDVPPDTRDAIVYLTLPARQAGAVEFQISEETSGDAARFLVDEEDAPDSFSNERTRETIETARPNLRFGVTRDQTYGRITVGLARIREVQNGQLIFDERYIPPTLDVRSIPRLSGFLTDILGRVDQRADELALRAVEATDGGAETFASFLLLQALNRWAPDAAPPREPADGAPRAALRDLRQHGRRAFDHDRAPTASRLTFPIYDHEKLQPTFEPVFEVLQAALVGGVRPFGRAAAARAGRPRRLRLAHHRPQPLPDRLSSIWRSRPARRWTRSAARFPSMAKIGAVEKMRQIVDSALPGVPLRHTPTPPPQLRVLPGYVYFELDRGGAGLARFRHGAALGLACRRRMA